MSSAVVSLIKIIPLPQFGHWIPVLDIITDVDRGVGRDFMCQVVDLYSKTRTGGWFAADAAGL